MRVAIFTTFQNFDRSYSLVGVALEQCAMLAEHGVPFTLHVLENFSGAVDSWLQEHVKMDVPTAKLEPDVLDDALYLRVLGWLGEVIQDYDVIITHDWMFVDWYITYNRAVRDAAAEHPEISWAHWVHSAPSARPNRLEGVKVLRYQAAPYAIHVYLNEEDRLRYAESIGTSTENVMVCYNPVDTATFLGMDATTARLVYEHRLWDLDIMQVYPFSTPRYQSKGVPQLIGLFGAWKEMGYRVKLVLVNSHCNAPREKSLMGSLGVMGQRDWGLTEEDLIFTSVVEGWDYSVPHSTVLKLFQMSNLFVFPTDSENCSRVLQEASMAGCMVIGNSSFEPMREFLCPSSPLHAFGSERNTVTYHMGANQWLREVARATTPYFNHPMFKQRPFLNRRCQREAVWREQFLPILERAYQMGKARVGA